MIRNPQWHDDTELTGSMALAVLGFFVILAIAAVSVAVVLFVAIGGAGK